MIRILKKIFFAIFVKIDARLKFPNLQAGDTAIQVGFDMSSPITSDLFELWNRVKPDGLVIGIDPDPENHKIAHQMILEKAANIRLVQKATYFEKTKTKLRLGARSSWNQLNNIPMDQTVALTNEYLEVETATLDSLMEEMNIPPDDISHINLTNNGAEYHTLLGMKNVLENTKSLSLTVIAGRPDDSGTINGQADNDLIIKLLQSHGFKVRFRRINQLFWWAVIAKLIINRQWVFGRKNYGVVMAVKVPEKLPWFQSFS